MKAKPMLSISLGGASDHEIPPPDGMEEVSGFKAAFEEFYKSFKKGEYDSAETSLKSLIEMVVHEQ